MNARLTGLMGGMLLTAWSAGAAAQDRRVDAPWRLSLDVGARWHHDGALDAFGASRSPAVAGLTVARDLLALGDRATLSLEVHWDEESFTGRLRDAIQSRLWTHTLSAGITARVRLLWWLEPYARLAAGALYSDVSLTPDTSSGQAGPLTGDEWTFAGAAGVGVQATTGRFLGPLRLAAAVEGGYQLALSQTIGVHPKASSDAAAQADRLPVADTQLGTVNQSGGYLRVLLGLRF